MKLFALKQSGPFGEAVADHLGLSLSEHEERDFEDGEHKIRPLTCVREEDVYIIHSLYGDDRQTVNDKLVRLLFLSGAVRDAGCRRVTAVLPYLCYARKDRKTKTRDPLSVRYVAQLLEAVGVDRVVTMDVHNLPAFQNAFRVPTVHLEAAFAFANDLAERLAGQEVVVVSPDSGGVKRADRFREILAERLGQDIPLAMMEKHRSEGVVSGELFAGDVEGRVAVVVDDLISSGTTLARTAAACRKRKAQCVFAVATHALLVGNAGEALANEAIEQILIANTVRPFRLHKHATMQRIQVLDVTAWFARAIRRLHEGGDVEADSTFR